MNNPARESRVMYALGYESMARSMNGFAEMFHSPDFAERRAKLVAGLPEDSVAAVDLILQRLKIILESKGVARVDLYTDEEQREFAAAKQILQDKIVQVGPNLYVWNGYALPCKHFESNVFLDGYGFRFIKTLGEIGDRAIIDAGAYVGDSALMLAPLTKGNVFAFEPMQDNFRLLEKTKLLNGLDNVIPVHKALGDCEGTLTMTVGSAGACATMQNRLPDESLRQETVEVVKLDDFVKSKNLSVGMIKTDVEGAEQLLLRGAKEIIQRDRPILLISIYHNASDFLDIKPLIESWELQYQFKIYHPPIKSISGETVLIAECRRNRQTDHQGPVAPVPELENSNRRLWRMCAEVAAADKADYTVGDSEALVKMRTARDEAFEALVKMRLARDNARSAVVKMRISRDEAQQKAVAMREARDEAQQKAVAMREARDEAQQKAVAMREARDEAQQKAVAMREARDEARRELGRLQKTVRELDKVVNGGVA